LALELNKLTAQIEDMGQVMARRQADYRGLGEHARATLEQHPDVTDALRDKIRSARKLDAWRRGATPLGDRLLERRDVEALKAGVTLIAADGSQIFPDRDGIGPYFLLNTGAIVFRRGSGQAPSVSSKPEVFYADSDIFDSNNEVRTAEYVSIQRQRREIEALADLAEAERVASGGDLSQVIVALTDGPLLPWIRSDGADSQALEREIEFTARQFERLRRAHAIPVGYVAKPDSAYVLRILELLHMQPEEINREKLREYRYQRLTDRAVFEDLGPNQRSAAFAANTDANDRYDAQTGDRIAFVYVNVARPGDAPEIARLEVPGWVAADPHELDKAQAAIYANCEPEGYPYVLARAHELAVVSPGERARLEEMLLGHLLRSGVLPEYSAKARNKLLTGSRPWR
jgi:hypothetical protein